MILQTKISTFEATNKIEVLHDESIGVVLNSFKEGVYKEQIDKLRKGDKGIKPFLPTFAVHGLFKHYRKKTNFVEASGIIILDIDDITDNIQDIKEDISDSFDSVVACMVSPSGNGIKILYYVDPELINQDTYKLLGKELAEMFSIYGKVDYLSVTDCLIATYDPDIYINEEATPDRIHIKQVDRIKGELEELDKTKVLWDDPEDFFDTVLYEDIASKTNSNFEFIQISMLDLKKFGFEHPKEDLQFVVDYAERTFKYSNQNKQRFIEMVEVAKNYPQLQWPYKLYLEEDVEDDEYVDYSEYLPQQEEVEDGEAEYDGLVDYDSLWNECLETMALGDRVGYEVALEELANALRFKGTGILTVTGIPGHGKTEMIDAILLDLARLYFHQSLIVGFEQSVPEHIIKLMRKMIGIDVTHKSFFNNTDNIPLLKENYEFITKYFKHIDTNKVGGNINDILRYSAEVIKKERDKGIECNYIVIDPFNMLSIKGRFSGHEKVEEMLRRLTHFSHQMKVLVFLVAHPFKMKVDEKTGQYQIPDFYSVKGSSAFFEMSYHGFVVYRNPDGSVLFKVLKVKQNNLGVAGAEVLLAYERQSGRYIPIDEEGNELRGDHREKNWLEKVKLLIQEKN